MRALSIAVAGLLVVSACSGSDMEAPTATVPSGITTTTSDAGAPAASTSSSTTTTTAAPTTTTVSSTTTSSTTSEAPTTTTTRAPLPPVTASTPPTPGCPEDLFLTTDASDNEFADGVLAAYEPPSADPLWSIPLGYDSAFRVATDTRSAYVLLGSGTLIALDIFDCAERWRTQLTRSGSPSEGGVAVEDGTLIVTTFDRVLAFDTTTGNELWSDALAGPAMAPVIRDRFAVVAGTTQPWLRSYWMPTGERLFDVTTGIEGNIESLDADFDAVYVAGAGTVEGRWIDDGALLFSVGSNLTSALKVFDVYVYVAGGNQVAALDFDFGEEIWRNTLTDTVIGALGIGTSSILAFTQDGQAHRLDFDNGTTSLGGSYGAFRVWPEFDDDAFSVFADDGTATVYSVFEQVMFPLSTGATGLDRFTQLDISGDIVVTFTYSAERF